MKLFRLLRSKGLAMLVISLMTVYCLIGVLKGPAGGSYSIDYFFAWPMKLLFLVLLINTLFCTIHQASRRIRFYNHVRQFKRTLRWKSRIVFESQDEVQAWLRDNCYKEIGQKVWGKRVFALSFILIFHFAFMLIGLGTLWSSQVRTEALVPITDGEELPLVQASFPFYEAATYGSLDTDNWGLKINDIKINYPDKGWPQDVKAALGLFDQGKLVLNGEVKKVPPIEYDGVQMNVLDFGFAPHISIMKKGQVLAAGYLSLMTQKQGGPRISKDQLVMPDGQRLEFTFLPQGPDFQWDKPSQNYEPANPYLQIKPINQDDSKTVNVALGKIQQVGPYEVAFSDFRYFLEIKFVRDPGMAVIFFGFWLGLVALAAHYLLPATFASLGSEGDKWIIYRYQWSSLQGGGIKKHE